MTKIIITGSKGRMGRALVACAAHFPDLQIVGQIDQGDDLRSVITAGEVVIDFSSHNATPAIVALCSEYKKAMVAYLCEAGLERLLRPFPEEARP